MTKFYFTLKSKVGNVNNFFNKILSNQRKFENKSKLFHIYLLEFTQYSNIDLYFIFKNDTNM